MLGRRRRSRVLIVDRRQEERSAETRDSNEVSSLVDYRQQSNERSPGTFNSIEMDIIKPQENEDSNEIGTVLDSDESDENEDSNEADTVLDSADPDNEDSNEADTGIEDSNELNTMGPPPSSRDQNDDKSEDERHLSEVQARAEEGQGKVCSHCSIISKLLRQNSILADNHFKIIQKLLSPRVARGSLGPSRSGASENITDGEESHLDMNTPADSPEESVTKQSVVDREVLEEDTDDSNIDENTTTERIGDKRKESVAEGERLEKETSTSQTTSAHTEFTARRFRRKF